jgi:hypothetical protein
LDLRADLASTATGKGGELVGFKQAGTGAVQRTAQDKMRETVSVLDFGASPSASATVNTTAFNDALAAANSVFVPAGTYQIDGTIVLSNNKVLYGEGARISILVQTANVSVIKAAQAGMVGRTQKIKIKGLQINGYAAMTATLLDLRNTSYMVVDDVQADGDPTGASTSGGYIIDNTRGGGLFNGYNVFNEVFALRGTIGLIAEVNQLMIQGGFYNAHSQRGIYIYNSVNVTISQSEVSNNAGYTATATYSGTYPTGNYNKGGIFLTGTSAVDIVGVWFENNSFRNSIQYSPNDIESTSDCSRINVRSCRFDNSIPGKVHMLGIDAGQNYGNGFGVQDHGSDGLVVNGQMAMADAATGRPLGWTSIGTVDSYSAPSLLPSGIGGIRMEASTGVPRLGQVILTAAQCQKLVGKKIIATFWAAAVNATWTGGHVRAGLGTNGIGTLSNGSFFTVSSSTGAAYKFTATYEITGSETNGVSFVIQFYQTTGPWQVELGDVSVSLGEVSWANFDKTVTSAGGDIWTTTNFKIGGARHSYGTAAPTTGTWARGDIVYNTTPSAGGFVGWSCVASGTPGTWKTFGAISA